MKPYILIFTDKKATGFVQSQNPPPFHLREQRVKVCAFTKTYRLSRFVRYHENQTDLSLELPEHLQYQKVYSEKLMFFHLVPQYC